MTPVLKKMPKIQFASLRPFLCPGILVTLGLGFALVPLAKGKIFFYWDNAQQHFAQTLFLHQSLRSGSLPHWWPKVGLGFPTVAEGQAAHFHPVRLIFARVFSPHVAFMAEMALYFAVAGLCTYLFLRSFRVRKPACLIGAFCQIFGSFSVVFVRNIALHRSFFLFPLAMLLAERSVSRRNISYPLAMSFVLGLQFLAGHPSFAIVTIVATSSYVLFRTLQRAWHTDSSFQITVKETASQMLKWGLGIVFSFGIASIQILPTLHHINHSIRQGGLDFEYASRVLAVNIEYLPQLFFPFVYQQGDWLHALSWWGSYFNGVPLMGIYIGALPLLLALLCIWWRPKWPNPTLPLAICFIAAYGLAAGGKTPLFPFLWSLPGLHGIRYPARFLFWASFCLACLAALGMNELLSRSRLRTGRGRDLLPFFFSAAAVLLIAVYFWTHKSSFSGNPYFAKDISGGILISLALFAIAYLFSSSLLFLHERYHNLILILVLTFILLDLYAFRVRSGYAPTVFIDEVLRPPPAAEFIKHDQDQFRVMSLISSDQGLNRNEDLFEFLQADTCTIWDIDTADDYSSLMLKRNYIVRESILWEMKNSPNAASKLAPFLGALNIKYVVAPKDNVNLLGWEKRLETGQAIVWENPAFLPRAFLVGKIIPEKIVIRDDWYLRSMKRLKNYYAMTPHRSIHPKEAQIIDNVLFYPVDYRTTSVVEASNLPRLSDKEPDFKVSQGLERADHMSFHVQTNEPAFLVISNTYYHGWSAWINGNPARIYRTNWVTMGVFVPSGESRVVFRFINPGFRLGLFVTIFSSALILLILLLQRRSEPVSLFKKI